MDWVLPDWVDPQWIDAAVRFFSFPPDATFWDLLNSPFLVAIIATLIGIRLSAKLSDTQADANTALRLAQTSHETPNLSDANDELEEADGEDDLDEDEPELPGVSNSEVPDATDNTAAPEAESELDDGRTEIPAPDRVAASRNYRTSSATIADKARGFIAERIAADRDKRHQRTYTKISRSNPIGLAIALNERGQLTSEQTSALIEIFEVWHGYSKGQAVKTRVPRSVLRRLRAAWERVGV